MTCSLCLKMTWSKIQAYEVSPVDCILQNLEMMEVHEGFLRYQLSFHDCAGFHAAL